MLQFPQPINLYLQLPTYSWLSSRPSARPYPNALPRTAWSLDCTHTRLHPESCTHSPWYEAHGGTPIPSRP